ncbi:MAG TPA: glycosyltransferase family 39 protein [Vicinamibacterales bacterium]|nr:glycosyltransferase family 39 protein [Vicinamibacterales bacterium]
MTTERCEPRWAQTTDGSSPSPPRTPERAAAVVVLADDRAAPTARRGDAAPAVRFAPLDIALLAAFPLLKLALHLFAGGGYGYHRDELYYLASVNHLSAGYVDHPALSVLILAAVQALAGSAVTTIRIVPAVAGALTVLLVGLMARRLGGGRFASALAMLAAIAAPFYLALDAYYSMNALDVLAWAGAAWMVIPILRGEGTTRSWVWLGLLVGLAFENKISALWLAGGIFVGLLLTPARVQLRTRGPWLAAAIASVLALPYAAWQLTHGLATLHFMKDAAEDKLLYKSIPTFFQEQFGGMLAVAAPVWIAGLWFYLGSPLGRRVRALGWTWVAVCALLAASHTSRAAYLAPAYTWLLAGGGVAIERWTRAGPRGVRAGLCAAIVAKAAFVLPLVTPILSEPRLAAYTLASGGPAMIDERRGGSPLPEFLAHMSGWSEIARDVAQVYHTIPSAERRGRVAILAWNYGEAGAVDVLGRELGLPPASSGHNSYWIWGPPPTSRVAVVVGYRASDLQQWFASVTPAGTTRCQYCMSYENGQTIWIVRNPRTSFDAIWRRLQNYE